MATKEEEAIMKDLNLQFRGIRAAPRNSEKAASLERGLLQRLIDLVTCQYSSVKILVAHSIPMYIKSSEDLEEAAINAVYDLCEDQDPNIRKEGYAAITSVSNNLPKYVKRNADVLVQLLQSDEPDEVKVVEVQLVKHLDKNLAVTLNVLCDQIIPPEEDIDEEEQAIRDRLRSLVIEFMTGRAKQNIVRHAEDKEESPDREFVDRVMRAISKIPPADGERLVKDIILSLPAYKAGSPRSKNLLQALLTAAEHTYESESKEDKGDVLLTYTRHLMSLASFVAREKGLTGTSPVVKFWCPHKLPTALADHLDEAPRLFVFENVLSAYDAIPARDLKAEISTQVRKSLVTACVPLFSRAVETHINTPRPWSAYRGLLRASKQHAAEMGWKVPPGMITALQTVQAQAKEEIAVAEGETKTLLEEVQNLTLSLLDLDKGSLASPNRQGKAGGGPVQIKRDRQPQAQTASAGRQGSSSTVSRQASTAQSGPRATNSRQDQRPTQPRRNNAGPTGSQDQFNPHKKLAVEMSAPTLLSRLALAEDSRQSRPQTPTRSIPAKRPADSDGQSQRRPNNPPVKAAPSITGFSIKGAATRQLESEKSVPLLNRLVAAGDTEGRRRKRPRV